LSNWFATAATLAVGFFLAPFIVHRLGNAAYGVWVLAVSSVGYLNLLDLGMRSSVLRFISKGHATQDHQGASEAISAALWVRLQIGALVLILSGGLAAVFPYLFKVPASFVLDAREAIMVIGVSTSVFMSVGVLGGVLSGLNRYDLQSYITLTQLAVRVIGVVTVLLAGYGIVAIALCELLAAVVSNALLAFFARRVYPELVIRLAKPKWEVLKRIWSYSIYAFLLIVSGQLIYQTDNLVVGAFVSATAVTFYSIGNSLCRYTQQIIGAMTITFTPAASTYDAAGATANLRALYLNGTRATMVLSLPIVITLIIRGGTFIGVWMGPQYSASSGLVLIILATALLFSLPNATAVSIAWGVEKHKTIAMWSIGEAVANLTLSVILARMYGLYGVAIGTLVPSLFVQLVLWPRYVSKLVDVSWLQVFRDVWGPVFLAVIPFAAASYAVDRIFPVHHLPMFLVQTSLLFSLFALTVGAVFWDNVKRQILPRARSFFYSVAK